ALGIDIITGCKREEYRIRDISSLEYVCLDISLLYNHIYDLNFLKHVIFISKQIIYKITIGLYFYLFIYRLDQ
ncbi:hypothetical protein ACJX0J_021782, partial [Zea mays]